MYEKLRMQVVVGPVTQANESKVVALMALIQAVLNASEIQHIREEGVTTPTLEKLGIELEELTLASIAGGER